MKNYFTLLVCILILSCSESNQAPSEHSKKTVAIAPIPTLNLEEANRLASLPIHCINTEYPNKLGQVLGGDLDLQSPKELHPAFYGCFDWHSAVHGHWSLVSLLKQFPELNNRDEIIQMLKTNISKDNILKEIEYFHGEHNKSYERTYGWAWLLKLAEELHTWEDPAARELEGNLQPLTDLLIDKYLEFLPKLRYPIRVGEHTNTAFGLTFAYDYAITVQHESLANMIKQRAKDFYLNDQNCPIDWEPSGYDFLSPCLQEAAIMKRILTLEEFNNWLKDFLPELYDSQFRMETGEVSDRKDGKLVHLDGVNFSRAWCLNLICKDIPELSHLSNIANQHINYSLPSVVGDSYEGGHWLGSFAIYSLNSLNDVQEVD